ncbi:hypothetical protein NC651_002452 [Populus alba x Populus x berolinensis]|nr:hypothetical protein NC651_002452 [Populus alba x Populus x berolinensis]
MFEKDFDLNHCGKKDYVTILESDRGQRLYGWIARDDDYKANDLLGEHLRKNGDLKTVCGKEAEDQRKDAKLLCNLTSTLKEKYDHLREMEIRYEETTQSLIKVMDQKESMVKSYNEEIRKMQQIAHDHFAKISSEHGKATQQLLAKREELVQCEKKLQQREVQIENERSKLLLEKKMNETATLEQEKADKSSEKEKLLKKIIELEKKLDAKQALELEKHEECVTSNKTQGRR